MLEVRDLTKEYPSPVGTLKILSGISLKLAAGDSAAIVGPSGSGKSTLLYILGALEPPTGGTVLLDDQDISQLRGNELAAFRNSRVGFVFQDHYLLPQCSVLENILVPTIVARSSDDFRQRAGSLLERVGLSGRIHHRPAELSGGEKQRVALARALILNPRLLLCDEPTGNLDHESTATVAALLLELHRSLRNVLVLVTHNLELAGLLARTWRLTEGRLTGITGAESGAGVP
jgi:lipoprotein-releasing system ATP-binding protein